MRTEVELREACGLLDWLSRETPGVPEESLWTELAWMAMDWALSGNAYPNYFPDLLAHIRNMKAFRAAERAIRFGPEPGPAKPRSLSPRRVPA